MYVKRHSVRRGAKRYVYLRLVEAYRDERGKVRHRVLRTLGRHKLSAGEVVVALIASRLASPSPLYDVSGWASGAALRELFGIPHQLLNDDRLGRCLEALRPHAEELRGAVMLRALERFGLDAARLHLDLRALRVAGAHENSALVEKGWSA